MIKIYCANCDEFSELERDLFFFGTGILSVECPKCKTKESVDLGG